MPKKITQILNQLNENCCEVYLYGIIGRWMDIDTNLLIPALEDCRKSGCTNFTFYVNSDGGEVIQCQALWNYLNRSDINVTWVVDGVAASCGYDMMTNPKHKVLMSKYSKLMVHKVSGCACGCSKDIRTYADTMDLFEADIIDMIANRCGKTKDEITSLYFDGQDHWFTQQQAIDAKLCDGTVDGNPDMEEPPSSLVNPTDIYNYFQNQIINLQSNKSMNHKEIAPILNMDVNSDEAAVKTGIQNIVAKATRLETENGTLKTEKENLQNQVNVMNQAKVKNLIDGAITSKRFGEDMRVTYTEMANENYERAEKVINSLPVIGRIANELGGGENGSIPAAEKDWTWQDYHKKGKLENLKATNPEHFKTLFKNEFKRDYKEA